MESLIARICREKKLTKSQLGIICDCDRSKITQIDSGTSKTITGCVLNGIVELGYDRVQVIQEYASWREYLAQRIKAQLVTN